MASAFGEQLKAWRKTRGLSQLDLAVAAGMSPRHLSFLETGRSRPRTPAVIKLAETLAGPRRERNALLRAAGLPAAYEERPLEGEALAPYRRIAGELLARQEPYPAFVVDGLWRVVEANATARALLPALATMPAELVTVMLSDGGLRPLLANFEDVARASLARMRREAVEHGRDALRAQVDAVAAQLGLEASLPPTGPTLIGPRLRLPGTPEEVQLVTTVARFSGANDVFLDEVRVELVFAADDASARRYERWHKAWQTGALA
ncbi:MAG: helix-turn-helix transcriptional regulator [Myxococcota bacterium]